MKRTHITVTRYSEWMKVGGKFQRDGQAEPYLIQVSRLEEATPISKEARQFPRWTKLPARFITFLALKGSSQLVPVMESVAEVQALIDGEEDSNEE